MQTRAVRLSLLALLLVTGLGAGLFAWDTQQRLDLLLADERDVDTRFDRLARNVAAFAAAQGASIVPGQAQGEALARGSALVKQIDDDLAALRPRARSAESATAFSTFADTLEAVLRTDARVREHLRIGQELMAADLVAEGRQSFDTLVALTTELQAAERAATDQERQALKSRAAMMLAGVTLLWVAGLFALARIPRGSEESNPRHARHDAGLRVDAREAHPTGEAPSAAPARQDAALERQHTRESSGGGQPHDPRVHAMLTEASSVCTAISRVATAAEIPAVLSGVAAVLDASGVIVWLGAGEELFAATAHGYHPKVLARLRPIRRHEDNATAAAWRACELQVVSGDDAGNGAIVTPLFSPEGCIGVLAAELRSGREHDPAVQAITSILAAQLATIVAAWPAPSVVEEPAASSPDAASEAADRGHTAATA